MATSGLNFGADVADWARQTQARMDAVFRESTQRVVEQAQSRIPVDTGFARASVHISTSQMPQVDPGNNGNAGGNYPYDGTEIALTIGGAHVGQTLYVGWTASYVVELEYGSSDKAPDGFVRMAAQNWNSIVAQVTQEAMSRAVPS